MKIKTAIFLFLIVSIMIPFKRAEGTWSLFSQPRIIFGGSTGFFRVSLDNFTKIYKSRWDNYYSAQASVRAHRNAYITLQYAQFQKEASVSGIASAKAVSWNERFINAGLRWYPDSIKRWRFYSGFGFVFVTVKEQTGSSLLEPGNTKNVSINGSGFYLEVGADYIILPHIALNLELEISSAGEGGTPGFMGSSLGGYALLMGFNFCL